MDLLLSLDLVSFLPVRGQNLRLTCFHDFWRLYRRISIWIVFLVIQNGGWSKGQKSKVKTQTLFGIETHKFIPVRRAGAGRRYFCGVTVMYGHKLHIWAWFHDGTVMYGHNLHIWALMYCSGLCWKCARPQNTIWSMRSVKLSSC